MTTAAAWENVLDAFAQRLEAQEAALCSGLLDPVPAFDAPALSTPLPHDLVERATALVWRCRALEESLQQALADAEARLDELSASARPRVPAEPVFFDSHV